MAFWRPARKNRTLWRHAEKKGKEKFSSTINLEIDKGPFSHPARKHRASWGPGREDSAFGRDAGKNRTLWRHTEKKGKAKVLINYRFRDVTMGPVFAMEI